MVGDGDGDAFTEPANTSQRRVPHCSPSLLQPGAEPARVLLLLLRHEAIAGSLWLLLGIAQEPV